MALPVRPRMLPVGCRVTAVGAARREPPDPDRTPPSPRRALGIGDDLEFRSRAALGDRVGESVVGPSLDERPAPDTCGLLATAARGDRPFEPELVPAVDGLPAVDACGPRAIGCRVRAAGCRRAAGSVWRTLPVADESVTPARGLTADLDVRRCAAPALLAADVRAAASGVRARGCRPVVADDRPAVRRACALADPARPLAPGPTDWLSCVRGSALRLRSSRGLAPPAAAVATPLRCRGTA